MRKIGITVMCICLCILVLTGCSESITDGISHNTMVSSNISGYIKDRYGADVAIDHLFMQGGANSTRVYIADVQIEDENYVFKGSYNTNGFYEKTTDTVINQVVDKYETERISNILNEVFDDFLIQVSSDVIVGDNVNFGKIPTYSDIINCGSVDSISIINIVGVAYCDLSNIKSELRGKGEKLAEIINDDIKCNIGIYLVDNTNKDKVSGYIEKNDITSFISVVNNRKQTDNVADCCNKVLRYSKINKESLMKDGPSQFISSITKEDEDEDEDKSSDKSNT